jgi:hypothetical protein
MCELDRAYGACACVCVCVCVCVCMCVCGLISVYYLCTCARACMCMCKACSQTAMSSFNILITYPSKQLAGEVDKNLSPSERACPSCGICPALSVRLLAQTTAHPEPCKCWPDGRELEASCSHTRAALEEALILDFSDDSLFYVVLI